MFVGFPHNWKNYQRQWEYILQSNFSIYPLLTCESFNNTTVKFEYMVFTGVLRGRTSIWAYHYENGAVKSCLWIPSQGEEGDHDEKYHREGGITVNIKEIINEVKNLLKNETEYRNGYFKRALTIMTDLSIVDYPPSRFENILSR